MVCPANLGTEENRNAGVAQFCIEMSLPCDDRRRQRNDAEYRQWQWRRNELGMRLCLVLVSYFCPLHLTKDFFFAELSPNFRSTKCYF